MSSALSAHRSSSSALIDHPSDSTEDMPGTSEFNEDSGSGGTTTPIAVPRPRFEERVTHRLATSHDSSSTHGHSHLSASTTPSSPNKKKATGPGLHLDLHHDRGHHDVEAGLDPTGMMSPGSRPTYRWLSASAAGGTGDEPGVDVRSKRDEQSYAHLTGRTQVSVVDWTNNSEEIASNVRVDFPGQRLKEWLDSKSSARTLDGSGRPGGVRWIHVEGLNWEVIKTLTLHYGLHPLSVEDALRSSNSPRSKLDFYKTHLYLQILIHHTHQDDDKIMAAAADALKHGAVDEIMTTLEGGEGHSHSTGDLDPLHGTYGRGGMNKKKSSSALILPEGVEGVFEPSIPGISAQGAQSPFQKAAHRLTVDQLSAKYMIPVRRNILSVFMTRDNTMITIAAKPCKEVLEPIFERLEDENSLLRRSGDVSMLAQAILDVSVDLAIEISQTFETEILQLEASVLVDPSIETVRHLHVLSSQLIRLRRSLSPLLRVCYVVRDQDVQRAQAASAMTTAPRPVDRNHGSRDTEWMAPSTGVRAPSQPGTPAPSAADYGMAFTHSIVDGQGQGQSYGAQPPSFQDVNANGNGNGNGAPSRTPSLMGFQMTNGGGSNSNANNGNSQHPGSITPQMVHWKDMTGGVGFFSPMTKVYIGDVLDHLEIICSSMDQFVATCDHLTDYVFNVLSFETNASMERLSIVTVIFLPLTFISSYFGMNFTGFPEIEGSVSYFWKVAAPCTTLFFLIFSFSYIKSGAGTIERKLQRYRRTREAEERYGRTPDEKKRSSLTRRRKSIW